MMFWQSPFLAAAGFAIAATAQSECPGYRASDVQTTANGLTANLQLAGEACNIYGTDLPNLTLTVEYQTGESRDPYQLHAWD